MIKYGCFLLFILLFISCGTDDIAIDSSTVFSYNEHANITTLDPAFAKDQRNIWACNLIYNGLVKLDKNLEVVPDLAASWTISQDALTYTFRLKDDVYFHENSAFAKARKVTATDFKYSLERLIDPAVASNGAWVMTHVEHIKVIDAETLVIELKQAFPAFLGLLTMKYCSVLMPEAVAHYGNSYRSNPVGTGPFYLKRWEENVKMVLRKNQQYHEQDSTGHALPYLEAVAITFKSDKQSEFLEYAQGNLDFINAIDPSYKDELLTTTGALQPKYESTTQLIKAPFLNTEYLGFYLDSNTPEIKSKPLRQAINKGFDRKKMIKYLRNNIGIPATSGLIPAGLPAGGVVKGYEYNRTEAIELVQQYIAATGNKNPSITITTGANYLDLCEFIQKELEKIGITTSVEVMPPSTLRSNRSAGQLDIFRSSWIADYPDAENYLSLGYSKNFSPNGPNYTHFKNETYDLLYEQALRLPSATDRKELYIKMDSIIINEAPIVPLYYDESVRFISKKVTGLETNAVNMLDLTRVRKSD